MPVTNIWDNDEKTIICMEVSGRWTWDEMYQASEMGYTMLESVNHMVYPIIDFSSSLGMPNNAITHARNMMGKQHPRTGMTVFVGANTLFVSLWRIFIRLYALLSREQDFTFAKSLDEAREMIAQSHQRKMSLATEKQ
ncbi:MAG: hypothetical protein ABI690_14215 [Chloroflexota bacterium]